MYCKKCGKVLNQGEIFCSNCGTKVDSDVNNTFQQSDVSHMQMKPKKSKLINVLAVIGGILVGLIVLGIIIVFFVGATSKKLVCKSNEGNITIMYNESGLTGYVANGIIYDFDEQKKYAEEIGVDSYLTQFNNWFISNTSGSCTND